MAETRSFNLIETVSVHDVGKGVESFLKNDKDMIVASAATSSSYVIQAKGKDDNWKKLAGMDKAIQIKLEQAGNKLIVDIGNGKWSDKVGAGTIGMFVFAPLAVTATIGAIGQAKLPGQIYKFIERFIECDGNIADINISQINPIIDEAGVLRKCTKCGNEMQQGQFFCPKCGTEFETIKTCSNCGRELEAEQKFCPYCGTKVEE